MLQGKKATGRFPDSGLELRKGWYAMPFASCNATRYKMQMIVGFRHKGLEAFYHSGSVRGVQPAHADKLGRILLALDSAATARELDLPSFRLHSLKGKLKDHWSIWVNGNWRVTFRFTGKDVELVDYLDYH